jgi:DNA invertase Pin-like site-specific DNA recombinase
VRAVVYARYSSDNQRDASIEDQLRVCRTRLEREGWTLVDTYADHAVSGATMLRPGYQALLAALRTGAFDIVVAESLDRFSRDLEHIAAFFKQTAFQNVRIHTLAEGEISELHVGLKGVMGALYLKDLADKTRRGLEGRVHAGRCTGSPPYGYTVVRKMRDDGELDRGLRAIDQLAASVVRRIFTEYAAGVSPSKIARALNAEGVRGPSGGIWYDASIRGREKRRDGILRNALYAGRIVWRRRLSLKDPVTGARLRRDASPDSFVAADAPDLRIIDDSLWTRVQARLQAEAAEPLADKETSGPAFWARRRPKHLLSGKVVCGVCGRPYYPTGKDYLACHGARHGACANRRTVRRASIERHVMGVLSRQLMQPERLAAFVQAFHAEWESLDGELKAQAASRQRERQAVERKIANLVDIISDGGAGPAILAKLRDLEATQHALSEAPTPAPPSDVQFSDAGDLSERYAARIAELTQSLIDGDDPEELEVARSLIDQVVIHPCTDDDPTGIELIGNLIDLLRAAGLGGAPTPGAPASHDPALALFVSSVKEGPGAEPLALLSSQPRRRPRVRAGYDRGGGAPAAAAFASAAPRAAFAA